MELLLTIAIIIALGVWERWFRKKKPYRPNKPQAPALIDDLDRGRRREE